MIASIQYSGGTTGMSQKFLLENIQAVIENAVPKIPGKWSNIRCIAIKTPTSMSLPFYNKTPEELSLISKMAGLEEAKVKETDVKAKKEAKRKLAANSPLVQALKKQKKMESEEAERKDKAKVAKKSEKKEKKKRSVSAEVKVEEKQQKNVETEEAEKTEEKEEGKSESAKKSLKKEKKKRSMSAESKVEEAVVVKKVEKKEKKKKRSASAGIAVEEAVVVKKIEKKQLEVKETVVVESKKNADFIASKKFNGSKKGYVFRAGKQGVGYYVDAKPIVDRMAIEAIKRSAAHQSRGGSRKKGRRGRR